MSAVEAFLLGLMAGWIPPLIVLAWLLERRTLSSRTIQRMRWTALTSSQPRTATQATEEARPTPITRASQLLVSRAAARILLSPDIPRPSQPN